MGQGWAYPVRTTHPAGMNHYKKGECIMKRKLLCLLLAMCMLLSLGAAPVSAAAPRRHSITVTAVPMAEEGITWAVDDGLLTISGTGAVPDYAQGEAPWLEEEIYSIIIEDGYAITDTKENVKTEPVKDWNSVDF